MGKEMEKEDCICFSRDINGRGVCTNLKRGPKCDGVCRDALLKQPTEGPSTEEKIAKFDTLQKIVTQLEWCGYECEAGSLNNNVAFLALKRMAGE